MSMELPELRLQWMAEPLRSIIRRGILDLLVIFALPRRTEAGVQRRSTAIWLLGAAAALFDVIWIRSSDFQFPAAPAVYGLSFMALIAIVCSLVRTHFHIQTPVVLIETLVQCTFASIALVLATYLIASLTTPWADPWLARADRLLGFDWVAVNRAAAGHEWLTNILRPAYYSFHTQPVAIIWILAFQRSHRPVQLFVLSWVIALAISVALYAGAPAMTAYNYFAKTHASLPDLSAAMGNFAFDQISSLRAGGSRDLLALKLGGLVTFPSFHTTGGILFMWALWPLRWLRWPSVALNVVMLASVPIIGSHYLIDMIAGVIVAFIAIKLSLIVDRVCGK